MPNRQSPPSARTVGRAARLAGRDAETILRAIQSHEALGSTGVGQGVALLALTRTTLAVWDLISGRIVRSFDLSWRPPKPTESRGAPGALAVIAGFLVLPWSVGLVLGALCLRYAEASLLRHVLGGVSAAAAGLLISTGLQLLLPHRRRPFVIGMAVLALILMAFSRLPLPIVLLALLPLSIAHSAARRS